MTSLLVDVNAVTEAQDAIEAAGQEYDRALARRRKAFLRARAAGMSVQEIADAAGITRQAVYKVLGV